MGFTTMPELSKRRLRNGVTEAFCRSCETWFPLEQMAKDAKCSGGRRPVCATCNRLIRTEQRKPRPDRKRYPLTPEQRERRNQLCRERYKQLRERGLTGREIKGVRSARERLAERERMAG
jgi:hypothetical protein